MGDHLEDTRGDTTGSPDVFVERIAILLVGRIMVAKLTIEMRSDSVPD